MKLATFKDREGRERVGALCSTGELLDLASGAALADEDAAPFASMQSLIEAGEPALATARKLVAAPPAAALRPMAELELLAPLPMPVQIRDCLSFEQHLKNCAESITKMRAAQAPDPVAAEAEIRASGRYAIPDVWYKQPIYYKGNRFAISGPDAEIIWPGYSQIMDFELEIACVIGRQGRDISASDADSHIFGFTIFNDFSARDAQALEQDGLLGPAKGKDFDGANAIGPFLVTTDEIADPYNLQMIARVNGEEWVRGNSSTIHWRFADMIAHISQSETLHAGEIIGSGTVGWGCGLEHMRFLQSGDQVELEIQGIGVLRNRVKRA